MSGPLPGGLENLFGYFGRRGWVVDFVQGLAFIWIQRFGYLLGLVSIGYAGFSWLILILLIGTWWARGAITMCIQKQAAEGGPRWEMPAHICLHLGLLVSLYVFSLRNILVGGN